MRWNLSHTYLDLPPLLYTEQSAVPVAAPRVAVFNDQLANSLGLEALAEGDEAILGGSRPVPGGRSFAQAYAGHQYAHFTMLGDGRALVLGEHLAPDGRRYDLQLKGSGRTPYSRSGDGRAALGPMLREYLISEAMHALGIPTTRALAVVETGEEVWRDPPQPGAVLTRVAQSHLRVGTFEYVAATEDLAALRALTGYAIDRHYPRAASADNPAAAFLASVVGAQANLIAQWMAVGFVHGVMNTDNMAISGETIDYGPCAFLDTFRLGQVFSSIDQRGRYAYGNQPGIARWNLTRLAEALLPVLHDDQASAIALAQPLIDGFAPLYQTRYLTLMAAKLGLVSDENTQSLVEGLLAWMEEAGADYTLTFRRLTDTVATGGPAELLASPAFAQWHGLWRERVSLAGTEEAGARMRAANPRAIPRNHRVEETLSAAIDGDYAPFHSLLGVLSAPFDGQAGFEDEGPPAGAAPFVTYCGT